MTEAHLNVLHLREVEWAFFLTSGPFFHISQELDVLPEPIRDASCLSKEWNFIQLCVRRSHWITEVWMVKCSYFLFSMKKAWTTPIHGCPTPTAPAADTANFSILKCGECLFFRPSLQVNGSGLSEVEETVKALEADNRALLHPVVVVWVSRSCCCCHSK